MILDPRNGGANKPTLNKISFSLYLCFSKFLQSVSETKRCMIAFIEFCRGNFPILEDVCGRHRLLHCFYLV